MKNPFKGLFGGKPVAKETPAEQTKAAPNTPGFRFIGGGLVPYDTDKLTYIEKGYRMNHMLYSVVKLIVDKAKAAPMAMYTVQDEQKYFEYQRLNKSVLAGEGVTGKTMIEMRDLRHKALKLDTSDGYMRDLLETPNDTGQTMEKLNEALMTFYLVTGDYFEAGWTPLSGGLNKGKPSQLYELPSQWTWISADGRTLPLRESGYELTIGGRLSFTAEDVSHCKMFNPVWDTTGTQLYGMSPIEAATLLLQAANLGTTREAKAMENAGADVVVYMDDPETMRQYQNFSLDQMGLLKERWNAEQGGFLNAGKAVWSPTKLGVARMGISPVDLGMLPAAVQNLRWFCNLYNVPSQLMNDPENKTFSNTAEGQRALLYNAVLPLLNTRQKTFTYKLRQCPAYKNGRKVVEFDTSIYRELEINKNETVTWLDKSLFDVETRYKYLDQEVPADMPQEVRKAILVPSGYQLLDDLFMAQQDLSGTVSALDAAGNNPYTTPVS